MSNREKLSVRINRFLTNHGIGMRLKLIIIFLCVQVVPLIILTSLSYHQIQVLGSTLREIAVADASTALNDSAVTNIERMSTDAADRVAEFLYARDDDILALAGLSPSYDTYRDFSNAKKSSIITDSTWELSEEENAWIQIADLPDEEAAKANVSTNKENEDMDGFHHIPAFDYPKVDVSLYDEITYVALDGSEQVKYLAPDSTKINYPFDSELKNIADKKNTYIGCENYFSKLRQLEPGEIYVSDVIGTYVGTNYIGMYTPENVATAASERGYEIDYKPEEQAYSGAENPVGQKFEGIVRWATPVMDNGGKITGYVTFALNHEHIAELVDHLTPMNERYTQVSSAYEGNYAFIWDYQCRSIVHPRHHSIVGYDPATGEQQIPWLETSIYEGFKESGSKSWTDYVKDYPEFNEQSREKTPAAELTKNSLVGLDGRYLNNAPQCIGWMDLTKDGGSGSFYILWSGIYKLNTAAAIPYYTGQYAPGEHNDFSKRGFGFVAVGSGLEDFTEPATKMEGVLTTTITKNQNDTAMALLGSAGVLMILIILIAIFVASSVTGNIKRLTEGLNRFRSGERNFRYRAPVKDEFGQLSDAFDAMADSVVDSVSNPLVITNNEETVIYCNELGLGVANITAEEMPGSQYPDISLYPANTSYDPILALKEGREAEVIYLEDSDRYVKGVANYLLDNEGEQIGYIIESIDMTEIIREQKEIEAQRALLDKVFSASPDLIWYMDETGKYLTVNPRFAAIAGTSTEDFVGKNAEDILPAEIASRFAANDEKAILGKVPLYSEEHITFADKHTEYLDSVRTPLYDSNGELIGLLGYARDVSSRVEIEDALRKAQTELEKAVADANAANQHKSEFLARMSHEIRTPMNAIIGLTAIVKEKVSELTEQTSALEGLKSNINKIEDSSGHLLSLLNDILDLSKIEAGRIELIEEASNLTEVLEAVGTIIQPRCEEKSITFVPSFDSFAPDTFNLDALRLRQVLINLLGNAVKFTPEGGRIEFIVKCLREKDGKTLVYFAVKDNGIGIDKSQQQAIFESFEQAGDNSALRNGGTGLGLAISKRIVNLFGGDLRVESTFGEGSEFYMELWLKQSSTVIEKTIATPDMTGRLAGKKMLLVDDVEINRIILKTLLEDTGIEIIEATTGKEAFKRFKASTPGAFDIIFMDILMPEMNGYEATAAIRALDRADAGSVPIIAQTAHAFQDDIDKATEVGMNGHMAKPIEKNVLMETLYRFLG
ncbi:ATP-binding protein [Ohessyouella blattaphilus]|uniref:Stage 0 sporulation protein A homolog n=1 Tax=Ohessyouella blattaphilus TaxID=2949333 RepID=A0ABT1EGM6_9FIRM|nr:ATP-binding protein [Ohessyouella blattaphilus]MCP1108841.1 ATP-binding protein [Ohessyouella blattaphilus]MCR8562235.1 ATP-binding protein [Ohessyouella blattaphilus]